MPARLLRLCCFVFLTCAASAVLLAAQPRSVVDPASGYSERPVATLALSQSVAENTMQFFRNEDFDGDMAQVSEVTLKAPWNDHAFGSKAKHFSSVRWNLPRGVIVTLFTRKNSTGRCLALWGSGQINELSKWKMNDELAGWAWHGVGGVREPTQRIKDGRSDRPKYARVAEAAADDSIHCFKGRDLKSDMTAIDNLTDRPANAMHQMPSGTSSLRWKLPPGVVVVFSEKADGVGPNLTIWGDGQFDAVALFEMNDKLRYYSWHYVGEPN
jgi:hypothetical protein